MTNSVGPALLPEMQPEDALALLALKARLSRIQPIGFPVTWDRAVAIEVLAAMKEFIDSVTTHEEDPDVSVSSFASEVIGDIVMHIHALDVGNSDPRLYPEPGGGAPAGSIKQMRNSLLAAVNAKAEQLKAAGAKNFKSEARRAVADIANEEGWSWGVGDREQAITPTLLRSWEKGRTRKNWSGHSSTQEGDQ